MKLSYQWNIYLVFSFYSNHLFRSLYRHSGPKCMFGKAVVKNNYVYFTANVFSTVTTKYQIRISGFSRLLSKRILPLVRFNSVLCMNLCFVLSRPIDYSSLNYGTVIMETSLFVLDKTTFDPQFFVCFCFVFHINNYIRTTKSEPIYLPKLPIFITANIFFLRLHW